MVNARRRVLRLLGSKQAVKILFDDIAPRFADRDGGYTRVLRLAKPRLGRRRHPRHSGTGRQERSRWQEGRPALVRVGCDRGERTVGVPAETASEPS